jgi:tetratricopeptide (TPR) repeat protein
MGEDEGGEDPLLQFARRLASLRAQAGSPSLRDLEKLTERAGHRYARATIGDKLSGVSLPDWEFVQTFVTACARSGHLPGEEDLRQWHADHQALLQALGANRKGTRRAGIADSQLTPEPQPALAGLPGSVPFFVARSEEMLLIEEVLRPPGESGTPADGPDRHQAAAVISGLPGVGKTELALRSAETAVARGWFPGGVILVGMQGSDSLRSMSTEQALGDVLRALGISEAILPADAQGRARLMITVLRTYAAQGRRVLLIIDDAPTAADVRSLVPPADAGAVLITSREALGLLAARRVPLDVLDVPDGCALLGMILETSSGAGYRVQQEEGAAAEIVRLCDGLPLALRITGALLADQDDRTLTDMAGELSDERRRLEILAYGDIGVRAAFELSYRRLPSPLARLLRFLALGTAPDVSTAAAAALSGTEPGQARQQLTELARTSLLRRAATPGRWALHDLVRIFAAALEDDGEDPAVARRALLRYYKDETQSQLTSAPSADGGGLHPSEHPAQEGWLDTEVACLVAAVEESADPADALALADSLHEYLRDRRRYDEWVRVCRAAAEAARLLDDCGAEGAELNNLGVALRCAGLYRDSLAELKRALRFNRAHANTRSEAMSLSNIGGTFHEMGDFEDAITYLELALVRHRQIRNHRTAIGDSMTLANALMMSNRPRQAVRVLKPAVALSDRLGDAATSRQARARLGEYLQVAGDPASAAIERDSVLADARSAGDSAGELEALHAITWGHMRSNRAAEAVPSARDALEIAVGLGVAHTEGKARVLLGHALYHASALEEAAAELTKAADILREAKAQLPLREALKYLADVRRAQAQKHHA